MADDATVVAAKSGDPEAWAALYRDHAGRLVAWLSTRPSGDAMAAPEDVAAEAWLVAASKIADFTGTSSDFAGWLFAIARRIAGTTRRRTGRRRTEPGELGTRLPEVADHAPTLDGEDWVRRVLADLPPRERDAVGLVDGLGFDNQTAARALGVSAVSVRVARHRGLRRLRRTLTDPPAPTAPLREGSRQDERAR